VGVITEARRDSVQQLTTTHNGLIPANQPGLQELLLGILREAQRRNGLSEVDNRKFVDYEPDLQARVAQDMLEIAARKQDELKVSQAFIVAHVARHELWRFEYPNLRDYLKDSQISTQAVSTLYGFGDTIVPYCDTHGIELYPVMGPENWGKLREAIPALKRAARGDDPKQVQEILDDVVKATGRDAIREKYRRHRHETLGRAATYMLPDGQVVMIALLNDDDASAEIVSRLDGRLEWNLVFICTEEGLVFECPSP
jgi:hypothetical protein